ncbi:MAG: hypothetical protein JWP81_1107 [Ferruginibacter sp.]|nr:hypothetical protein [Ferruginibacter sp.]
MLVIGKPALYSETIAVELEGKNVFHCLSDFLFFQREI